MLIRGLLRLTLVLFAMMLVGSSIALLVGHFMPTQMLTTAVTTIATGNLSGITDFLLVDLNRHLRITIPFPVDNIINDIKIDGNGQEALILTGRTDKHLYIYNLMSDTLRELNSTYIYPETGE